MAARSQTLIVNQLTRVKVNDKEMEARSNRNPRGPVLKAEVWASEAKSAGSARIPAVKRLVEEWFRRSLRVLRKASFECQRRSVID
jgi:hypothetical protein